MLLIIPLVEIKRGKCSFCIQGELNAMPLYEHLRDDPGELCKLLRKENSKSVHVNDIDSFADGYSIQKEVVLSIVNSVDVPVQLYANFKNADECRFYLDNGVYRIFINRLLYENPDSIKELINDYTQSRVAFALPAAGNNLDVNILPINDNVEGFINKMLTVNGCRLLYENTIDYNVDSIKAFAINYKEAGLRITLIEAAKNPHELWALQDLLNLGVDSVILGKSLYNNNFPCQKIWRLAEAELDAKEHNPQNIS